MQAEYDYQKNILLENWDREEFDIGDTQERAEFKLKLITYIQNRDFNAYKAEMELKRATAKNDARLEVILSSIEEKDHGSADVTISPF